MNLKNALFLIKNVRPLLFIYYNYMSKNIIHEGSGKIVPYKHATIDLSKDSRIYIGNGDLEIGTNRFKGSKEGASLRMCGSAIWKARNGCQLFYNTTIDIKNNAVFDTGYFTVNGGSTIVCAKKIKFGQDVMLGRNITIYDSDFHRVLDKEGNTKNPSKPVEIGDHVWLTNQIYVLKGVTIGSGSIVSPNVVIRKSIPENSMVVSTSDIKIINNEASWSRKPVEDIF